jgi:hypothetical protein
MIQPQIIVQSDYGYELPFTLQDANGNAVNLTGTSLAFKVQSAQDQTQTDLTLSGSMTIDSAVAGTCHYTVGSGDFPNPGTFNTMIVATWSSSEVLSWTGPQLIVNPSLPKSNN